MALNNTFCKKPQYGYDAPGVIKRMLIYSMLTLSITIILSQALPTSLISKLIIATMVILALFMLMPAVTILLGSVYFKFRERDWLFSKLPLKGNENILDLGCGHGLLLIAAAKQITTGKVHGLDLWVQADQYHNSKEAALRNAKIENVESKIEIHSGDMRKIPFSDTSMDIVISSWAIHNIYNQQEREIVLAEIIRVLKPSGRIAILDIEHAPTYRDYFIQRNLQNVQLLGPRYTFGNKTYLVLAEK